MVIINTGCILGLARVAENLVKMSHFKRGMGHEDMTKNQCGKRF